MAYRSDLWAIGCILYQCIAGTFAFSGPNNYLTMEKVRAMDYSIPQWFDPAARDLVEQLLVITLSEFDLARAIINHLHCLHR